MNYPLARELYGQPWCMDSRSLPGLLGTLAMIRSGVNLEIPETKLNTPYIASLSNESRVITRPWQLDNNEQFDGIGVININGPITVNGGASTMGMVDLSNMMQEMAMDSRIVGFVIRADSGGGASAAVEIMVDTINQIKATKPVLSVIAKGGMAASAMYGILTATSKIYAESGMSIVGSAGTMIQFDGNAANTEDSDGNKRIRLYATKSTMKNKDFEEALNNDNYEPIINDLLDPVNDNFVSMILANRPILNGTDYDNGHTVFAKNAIGTFIDGIASFEQVIKMVEAESSIISSTNKLINNNSKSVNMTRDELKNQHPETFNAIHSEGVTAERERVNSWMVYAKADPETVSAGIESGKDISPSQRENLMVKMHSVNMLSALQKDSHKDIATEESSTAGAQTAEQKEIEAVNNEWLAAAKKAK